MQRGLFYRKERKLFRLIICTVVCCRLIIQLKAAVIRITLMALGAGMPDGCDISGFMTGPAEVMGGVFIGSALDLPFQFKGAAGIAAMATCAFVIVFILMKGMGKHDRGHFALVVQPALFQIEKLIAVRVIVIIRHADHTDRQSGHDDGCYCDSLFHVLKVLLSCTAIAPMQK